LLTVHSPILRLLTLKDIQYPMGLFQKSVLKKYLKGIDEKQVNEAWERFKSHFHNSAIQENIRRSKEEQHQGEFLIDLFVKVLGYTNHPLENYNLIREQKNIKDAKSADGAIIKDGKIIAVIELKGTDTTNLSKIETQAFGYKNNQPDAVYIITSNFEKLRFYIDNSVDFEDFNLFQLTQDEFNLLWLCLSKNCVFQGIPKQIKEESLAVEETVTNKLYKDYSAFRNDIFTDIVKNNPQYDKLTLFNKTQKLLDRFLFVFFAEDRLLLPPNSIREIVNQWTDLRDQYDEYQPLYSRFIKYFGYLNTGFKGKKHDIFAYNGGLFLPDEILDNIKIDDTLLYKHTLNISNYDFESEVSVNILGHIFEHSLSEIEEIQAELEGQVVDKDKTKRKKDGVFYTPKYITKYIVDNTVGSLCKNKKLELGINEEEYEQERTGKQNKAKVKVLQNKLEQYRNWLLEVTICDPACGSGAFLNQALEFLVLEHRYVDELQAKLFGDGFVFQNVENSILENNLFGVDINEESIEIAKLSLWLRTAQKGRKLTSLNNNIKCGNSLIADKTVAGDKAFDWENEFPEVFAKGGFDVVIGNPPYLRVQGLRANFEIESKYYENVFQSATGRFDIYVLFMERSFKLISGFGKVGFILPHKFMVSDFGEGIRAYLSENKSVESVIHFGSEMVFADASTYTCIITLSMNNQKVLFRGMKPQDLFSLFEFREMDAALLTNAKWNLHSVDVLGVMDKIKKQKYTVKDIFEWISQGVVSVGDDIFYLKGRLDGNKFIGFSEKTGEEVMLEASLMKPLLKGEDVKKYGPLGSSDFVIYPHYEKDGKTLPYEEEVFKQQFPLTYSYFLPYKEELIEKKVRYKTNPKYWYSLHRSREISLFKSKKIVTPETSFGTNMTIDENGYFHNTQVYTLIKKANVHGDERYLLTVLNSEVMWFFLKCTGTILRGGYFRYKTKYLEPFPIPLVSVNEQKPFIEKAEEIMFSITALQKVQYHFLNLLQSKFAIEKLSKNLQNWYELKFKDFLLELKKIKIQLRLSEEAEWMQYFNEQKRIANGLQTEIKQTNQQIDQLVYQLYELTPEEIKIVEGQH